MDLVCDMFDDPSVGILEFLFKIKYSAVSLCVALHVWSPDRVQKQCAVLVCFLSYLLSSQVHVYWECLQVKMQRPHRVRHR